MGSFLSLNSTVLSSLIHRAKSSRNVGIRGKITVFDSCTSYIISGMQFIPLEIDFFLREGNYLCKKLMSLFCLIFSSIKIIENKNRKNDTNKTKISLNLALQYIAEKPATLWLE